MNSNGYKEVRISLYILSALLAFCLLFYFVASMFTSMGYSGFKNAEKVSIQTYAGNTTTVIIDAGHGGEDPGAVVGDLIEKELNLDIAFRLNDILSSCGYNVVLTRSEDRLLYNYGEDNQKKFHDIRNREAIADSYENAIFVSIHMNKFPAEYCKGLQVFYSENNENSLVLATDIQKNACILQKDNKRTVKSGNDTIYLMDNINIPAVLVECGFLSNAQEAALLNDDNYKNALVLSLYCGIVNYLENNR